MIFDCKICRSELREYIEKLHSGGKSLRAIEKVCKEEFGANFSHVTLGNHLKFHTTPANTRVDDLESRIRNLEFWLLTMPGNINFGEWFFVGKTKYVSWRQAMAHTVPKFENLEQLTIDLKHELHLEDSEEKKRRDLEAIEADRKRREEWLRKELARVEPEKPASESEKENQKDEIIGPEDEEGKK